MQVRWNYLFFADIWILRRSELRAVSRSCELLAYSSDGAICLYALCPPGGTLKVRSRMQIEAPNTAEKIREAGSDPGGDGEQVIALRSELARKMAAHIPG